MILEKKYINLCYTVLMSSEKCYFSCCTRTNKQIVSDPILYLFHSFFFLIYFCYNLHLFKKVRHEKAIFKAEARDNI